MDAAPNIEQPVVDFFLGLQRALTAGDADGIIAAFAPEVLLGDPDGARAVRADGELRLRIDEWLALLRSAGAYDVKALQIEPLPLGPGYALAAVRWSIWFTPEGRPDFVDEFLVDYVVRFQGESIAIVAAFAHDTTAELRRRSGAAERA
ncbi:MAG: hypothetical protein R2848_02185 [Thermomicrobiales bacterium]